MTPDNQHKSEETERSRRDGRRQGQGWYLEDRVEEKLLDRGFRTHRRIEIWRQEVDVIAQRDREQPTEADTDQDQIPSRVVASCMDWFEKDAVTPARMWRLIAIALTVRAEPLLVHNRQTRLTSTAQEIAGKWQVRVVTDADLEQDIILPPPETAEGGWYMTWPAPLGTNVEIPFMRGPDYSFPASKYRRS